MASAFPAPSRQSRPVSSSHFPLRFVSRALMPQGDVGKRRAEEFVCRIGLSQRVDRFVAWIYVNWKAMTVIAWLGICAWFLVERWNAIYWLYRKSILYGKSGSVSVYVGGR